MKLINNVLDMARIESGKLELDIRAHHIPAVVQNVEYIFQADIQKKKLDFQVFCDIQDEVVFCDLLKMNQIELNLIGNAIKYTPEGGRIVYYITQTGEKDGYASYRCVVKDNGIGMSAEFCKKVFDAFERESSDRTTGVEGSGLGLAITKRLIDKMGGNITCQSEPGKGAEFIYNLTFPIGTEADLEEKDALQKNEASIKGKRLLLVEDNELNREISRDILEQEGFVVEEAEDGAVAVEKVRASAPGYYALVLMDVQMPRVNGYEATRQIRALENPELARIPIIAVTANAFDEDRQAAVEAGMNGHIAKPIELKELREQVMRWIK